MLLKITDMHTFYGLSHILFGVSMEVEKGEVVFLLGRNGVGKTTSLRSIMGAPPPRSGSIEFHGQEIAKLPTYKIARLGITLVPEGRRIIAGLTVRENLEIAAKSGDDPGEWTLDRIYRLFPILREREGQEGITLSGGEQQMLAIARALMSNPRLLLVDEPTEGLAPLVKKAMEEELLELKQQGITILLADDDTRLATKMADRVYIMDQGRIVWEGAPKQLLEEDQDVIKVYLGIG
jgi:branched-chain amino acid transport system ATP-binding protein